MYFIAISTIQEIITLDIIIIKLYILLQSLGKDISYLRY